MILNASDIELATAMSKQKRFAVALRRFEAEVGEPLRKKWYDPSFGPEVDAGEVMVIRQYAQQGMGADEISAELNIDYDDVLGVLNGKIAPYVGLSPPVRNRGLSLFTESLSSWQRNFMVRCIAVIGRLFNSEELEAFLSQQGITLDRYYQAISNLEDVDEYYFRERFRYLLCHPKGPASGDAAKRAGRVPTV